MSDYPFDTIYDKQSVGMAYVPWQKFNKMPENLEAAYQEGSIFPELIKPFTGKRGNPSQKNNMSSCKKCNERNMEVRNGK
ncbi:MAG: spore coat associated protein CotJA [Lachnospiraceae bacterium]|nr:spore coat associated protein CotJA [Lachnospiraceae bacterium]